MKCVKCLLTPYVSRYALRFFVIEFSTLNYFSTHIVLARIYLTMVFMYSPTQLPIANEEEELQ